MLRPCWTSKSRRSKRTPDSPQGRGCSQQRRRTYQMRIVDGRLLIAAVPKGAAMRRGMVAALNSCIPGRDVTRRLTAHRERVSAQRRSDRVAAGHRVQRGRARRAAEVFHSEVLGGVKSYMVDLGDLAFNSPVVLGGPARRAGMSCGTCHVNGAGNRQALRPGHVDPAGKFRHHRSAVQSQGTQQRARSGPGSEPARRALPRALRQ